MQLKYVMINSDKIVMINNISGSTYTDIDNNKYNEEKVQYMWEKGKIIHNPKYIPVHYLEEKNGGN
jgi:hypothetical protein